MFAGLILAATLAGSEPVPDSAVAPTCEQAVARLRAELARAPDAATRPVEPTIVCLDGKAMVVEERPQEALPAKADRCRAGACVAPASTREDAPGRRR